MAERDMDTFREYVADHVRRYLATDGDDGAVWNGVPCVLLTTVGARSGEERISPIVRVPVPDTEDYLAVGSMGGAPKHPAWVFNLRANPDRVRLQDRAVVRSYRARETEGAERSELWGVAVDVFDRYAGYQEQTDRTIPVFRLSPTD